MAEGLNAKPDSTDEDTSDMADYSMGLKSSNSDVKEDCNKSKEHHSNARVSDDAAEVCHRHGNKGDLSHSGKLQKMDSGIDVEKSPSTSMREGFSDGDGCDSVSECFADSTGFSHSESIQSDYSPTQPNNDMDVDALFSALGAKSSDTSSTENASPVCSTVNELDDNNIKETMHPEDGTGSIDGLDDGTEIILWPPEEATISSDQAAMDIAVENMETGHGNADGLEDGAEVILWPPEEATASASACQDARNMTVCPDDSDVNGLDDGVEVVLWPPEEATGNVDLKTMRAVKSSKQNGDVSGLEDGIEVTLWPLDEASTFTTTNNTAVTDCTRGRGVQQSVSGAEETSWTLNDSFEGAAATADMDFSMRRRHFGSLQAGDADSASEDRGMDSSGDMNDKEEDDAIVNTKPWPTHKWHALKDICGREIGTTNCIPPSVFREKVHGSLRMVQRLNLLYKMEHHEGCVNSLHFNGSGTLLASGSDDLQIVLWNWAHNRPAIIYDSGHRSNVFQAVFMPFSGDCAVASCARDGQVRVGQLSLTGRCKSTRKLAQHKGAAHKLALEYDSAHVFLSCGEDAVTFQIDVREEKPKRLVITKENGSKVALYSIHSNPFNPHEFLTSGRDPFVRVYDKRKINQDVNDGIVKKFCPEHLRTGPLKTNVTCACYSYNGTEIVGSYNDEDIYLFDNIQPDNLNAIHHYSGHRNNATVKGVSFYGPCSEYILSGSDCGHIFLWDKETEHTVQFLVADDCGVVNVLETHPFAPVFASSGLDPDVKIWAPICPEATPMEGLMMQGRENRRNRRIENERTVPDTEMIDSEMMWFITNHFNQSARRRARRLRGDISSSSSDSSSSDVDDDDDDDDDDSNDDDDDDDDVQERRVDQMQCETS